MSRAQFTVAFSTDEEAAASKRMVIYAFSAQINLFTSFFLKQPLRNTVFILFPFRNTYSLRSSARTATKNRAIATSHCLLKNGLVELVSNTLNDGNLQKISLVVSLLARSFRSQLNRCAPSDPRDQVKITTKTYLFEVCRFS